MKVLVTSRSFGKVSPEPLQILKDAGLDVIMMGSDYTDEKFAETITDCDALIIGAHKFHPELMAKCKKLQIVAKHGAGLDNLDIPAAKALGVTVTNVPAMNANAVADLTVGLMLDVLRGISKSSSDVKNGIWRSYIGKDMYAKTLGLIGFGNIAKNVARRAKGFSMKIIAYDPYITDIPEEFKGYVRMGTLEEVLKQGDIVSVHIPLSPDTLNLLCKDTMLLMKKGAFQIGRAHV